MQFLYPVPKTSLVSFTYDQHVAKARKYGWCYQPGNCTTFYFGGIDWAIVSGTPVKAAQDGTVTIARSDKSGYGTHVRIQHDEGYLTVYGHLSKLKCKVNDEIKAGDVIGLSGNTGNSTGPHLHFECRKDNVPFDPAPLLYDSLHGTQPEPEPQPVQATVTTTFNLNVRLGPGTSNKSVGIATKGTSLEKIGGQGEWVKVALWVHGDYVK